MYLQSPSLRAIAWSTLAIATAHAQHAIDDLSFGHTAGYLSPNLGLIPHFSIQASGGHHPQILSDRIILTPPYPGNIRASVWADTPLHHPGDWTAELHFRASGMERGRGNLQIWYVKQSQAHDTPTSLYTAPKFDGLVLVIDQFENRGGSVRGFLNDGAVDIKSHPAPDTLAFGSCDYPYRNRGEFIPIKLHHAEGFLEVTVDGTSCFKTDKVKLPDGYYFGISASSADNPDSFEVQKFVVSTTTSPGPAHSQHQQTAASQQAHDHYIHHSQQPPLHGSTKGDIPKILDDVPAASLHTQQEQFADLHNRMQIMYFRLLDMYDVVDDLQQKQDEQFKEVMARMAPLNDRTTATMHNVEKIERTTMQILRDLESKDFKDLLEQVHRAVASGNEGLSRALPLHLGAAVKGHGPSMTTFLFIAVAAQIMVTGAYMVYKKRKNSTPKKYL